MPRDRRVGTGIIPARAGFTGNIIIIQIGLQDHPRSRGVYAISHHQIRQFEGSSPLARGLRALWNEHYDIEGIIPARAGFTGAGEDDRAETMDHPRSRGVYT